MPGSPQSSCVQILGSIRGGNDHNPFILTTGDLEREGERDERKVMLKIIFGVYTVTIDRSSHPVLASVEKKEN